MLPRTDTHEPESEPGMVTPATILERTVRVVKSEVGVRDSAKLHGDALGILRFGKLEVLDGRQRHSPVEVEAVRTQRLVPAGSLVLTAKWMVRPFKTASRTYLLAHCR